VIWRSVGGTPARQRAGTETLPRHCLSSASEKGGPHMSRARLILALVNLALVAAWVGQFRLNRTFSDGD